MASDAVVALGQATKDGSTLFGQTNHLPARERVVLEINPGRSFALGEKISFPHLDLPQVRQTFRVLGARSNGCWGFFQGVNEHSLAAGCVGLKACLPASDQGLCGTDLVRLILERCRNALQAVDLLVGLLDRYGQGMPANSSCEREFAFLIADPSEAYAVETAGKHWVYQEVRETRAVSNVRVIHQDWDRISSGLAAFAIGQGRWQADGSKLNFAEALHEGNGDTQSSLRRWARATFLLQEQNGQLDTAHIRTLLGDHGEPAGEPGSELDLTRQTSICQHAKLLSGAATASSFTTALRANPAGLQLAWCAFGSPCSAVHFPILLDGDLPEVFTGIVQHPAYHHPKSLGTRLADRQLRGFARQVLSGDRLALLQARFDQEADEVLTEAAALKQKGALDELCRLATSFMQFSLERYEEELASESPRFHSAATQSR